MYTLLVLIVLEKNNMVNLSPKQMKIKAKALLMFSANFSIYMFPLSRHLAKRKSNI